MGSASKICCTKIRGLLYRFKYLKPYLDIKHLKILYYSLVQSHLTYDIIGWGGICDSYLKNINNLQKWILRIIYGKSRNYPSDDIYKISEIFDLRQLFSLKILLFSFKNKKLYKPVQHQYTTRNKENNYQNSKATKTIGQKCYSYLGSRLYNRLPKQTKNTNKLHIFKKNC